MPKPTSEEAGNGIDAVLRRTDRRLSPIAGICSATDRNPGEQGQHGAQYTC